MPHLRDICLNKKCQKSYEDHKGGRGCKKFEFVAASSRADSDILVSASFASESSPRIYAAIAWRQGDFSCNCTGWRNNRTCWHIDDLKKNPQKYKGNKKTTRVITAAESHDIMSTLQGELTAAKANPAMYSEIKNKIQFFQTVLSVASESLDKEMDNKAKEVMSQLKPQKEKTAEPAPLVATDADDPFGGM